MAKTLTTKQLQVAFGVGHMTIYNWRAGTAKRDPLPCIQTDGRITFELVSVKAWAKKYELPFAAPTAESEVVKPGPKTKTPPVDVNTTLARIRAAVKKVAAKASTPLKSAAPPKKAAEKSSRLGRAISAHAKKAARKTQAVVGV